MDDPNPEVSFFHQEWSYSLLKHLPICDEYDNGNDWRPMEFSDAIKMPNTWFWRLGDPWLRTLDALLTELKVPAESVLWKNTEVALIENGKHPHVAVVYAYDSRYECFAIAEEIHDQPKIER